MRKWRGLDAQGSHDRQLRFAYLQHRQYLGELGADVHVYRNDAIRVAEIEALALEQIVISPGSCTPNEAGISVEVIKRFSGQIPLLGVYDPVWIDIILDVLRSLNSEHVLIVSADDGMDEISIASDTRVGELRDGRISHYVIKPEDFGIERRDDFTTLQVTDPQESLALRAALTYENQAAGEIVALNAGAAMYAANVVSDIGSGVARA